MAMPWRGAGSLPDGPQEGGWWGWGAGGQGACGASSVLDASRASQVTPRWVPITAQKLPGGGRVRTSRRGHLGSWGLWVVNLGPTLLSRGHCYARRGREPRAEIFSSLFSLKPLCQQLAAPWDRYLEEMHPQEGGLCRARPWNMPRPGEALGCCCRSGPVALQAAKVPLACRCLCPSWAVWGHTQRHHLPSPWAQGGAGPTWAGCLWGCLTPAGRQAQAPASASASRSMSLPLSAPPDLPALPVPALRPLPAFIGFAQCRAGNFQSVNTCRNE